MKVRRTGPIAAFAVALALAVGGTAAPARAQIPDMTSCTLENAVSPTTICPGDFWGPLINALPTPSCMIYFYTTINGVIDVDYNSAAGGGQSTWLDAFGYRYETFVSKGMVPGDTYLAGAANAAHTTLCSAVAILGDPYAAPCGSPTPAPTPVPTPTPIPTPTPGPPNPITDPFVLLNDRPTSKSQGPLDSFTVRGDIVFNAGEDPLGAALADGATVTVYDGNDAEVSTFTWDGSQCASTNGGYSVICRDSASGSSFRLAGGKANPTKLGIDAQVKRRDFVPGKPFALPLVAEVEVGGGAFDWFAYPNPAYCNITNNGQRTTCPARP